MKLIVMKLKLWLRNNLQKRILLCRRIAHCRLKDSVETVGTVDQNAGGAHDKKRNTLAQDRGRRRLFEHMRDTGEQVETVWESGKTIRHLTQEEGQGT